MLKKNADRWIKALLSGKYKQGKQYLNNSTYNTYCCLGVLVDINNCTLGGGSSMLTASQMKACDIKTPDGFMTRSNRESLAITNDRGKSFEYIAALIKKHYKEL